MGEGLVRPRQRGVGVGRDVIEGRLIQIGMRALELGINVVIDFGLWSRDERSALRQAAAAIGAAVVIRYFELPPAEQRERLDRKPELTDATPVPRWQSSRISLPRLIGH
jgi:hypothetical protein